MMVNSDKNDIFDEHFEDKEWYEERNKFYRYVIYASVGILTTLILWRLNFPKTMLVTNWYIYRLSLMLSATTAFLGLLTYYLSFRNRFFVRKAKNFILEYPNKKKTDGVTIFESIYFIISKRRLYLEKYGFYLVWGLTQICFLCTLSVLGWLLFTIFRQPIFK